MNLKKYSTLKEITDFNDLTIKNTLKFAFSEPSEHLEWSFSVDILNGLLYSQ